MIGAGARKLIERGLELEGRVMSVGDVDRLLRDFIDYYAAHIADASRPFEGLEAALDDLGAQGYRFAVCTNKLEWLSKRLLDELGLSPRFSAICGADTFGVAKPDPVILQQTVSGRAGISARTIMVGDAGPDVGVARRAGIPVIGVEFGYTDVPIAELKPDRLIGHMRDRRAAVLSLGRTTSGTPNQLILSIFIPAPPGRSTDLRFRSGRSGLPGRGHESPNLGPTAR